MPFTVSPGAYQGGNFLFAGLSSFGKDMADALEKAQEQSKMESYNDSIVQHAYDTKQIDLEQLTKYRQMSHTQKTGYAASLAANFAEDLKREQLAAAKEARQAQAEQRQATAELRTQQAAAFNWTPDQAAQQAARWTGNELVQTGPGKFQPVPYGGGGMDKVETDPLTINGQVIPGIGVNRKTGAYVYFPQDIGGGIKIEIEPRTGTPFYRDIKGNPHALTGQQVMAGQMLPPEATPTPTPTPAAPGTTIGDIWDAIGSIGAMSSQDLPGGGATPMPSVTPTPVPGATAKGEDVTAGAAKRQQAISILQNAGKVVNEQTIQAVIKKLEAAGK